MSGKREALSVLRIISKNVKIIVIACNTARAICVDYLRDKYKDICFIAT